MFILAGNGDREWKALDCLIYESFGNKIVFSDVLMFEKFSYLSIRKPFLLLFSAVL